MKLQRDLENQRRFAAEEARKKKERAAREKKDQEMK